MQPGSPSPLSHPLAIARKKVVPLQALASTWSLAPFLPGHRNECKQAPWS